MHNMYMIKIIALAAQSKSRFQRIKITCFSHKRFYRDKHDYDYFTLLRTFAEREGERKDFS